MATIKLKAVKLKDNVLEVTCTRTDAGGPYFSPGEKHKTIVHDDLKEAFAALSIHIAVMSGAVPSKSVKDITSPKPELFEDFHARSYSIGGDEDDPGVVISGTRNLSNGKPFNFNTPFYRFEEGESTRYVFMEDLREKLDTLEAEVLAYLSGEKVGVDPQGKLEFDKPQTNGVENQETEAQ